MTGSPIAGLTPYVRQAREHPAYRWWRLPLGGLVAVIVFLVASVLVFAVGWWVAPGPIGRFMDSDDLDISVKANPVIIAVALLSIAVMLPSLFGAVRLTGPRPVGHLSSVYGRLRWRWLLRALAVAFALMFGSLLLLTLVLEPTPVSMPTHRMWIGIAVVALLTPFQAAAEEYAFRGYLMQLVGSWTRWAWLPVLVSVPLFAAAHGYSRWGTVDVGIFGLTASILVIRTGGLEASIALHIANNVTLGVLEAFGLVDTSDKGTGPWDVVPTFVTAAVFIAIIEWMFRRSGLYRGRRRAGVP